MPDFPLVPSTVKAKPNSDLKKSQKATFILLKVAFLRSCEKNRQRLNPENAKRQNMILILEFYLKNIEKQR